ncbi:GerMN domain-containing protein, partial [Dialister invisus]|uniref:GerMN domain-containing protein n=1 Tax=Dialister invisus TaxID=218538 RepID=UPI0023A80E33
MKKIYLLGAAFLISLGITGCTPATTATPPASKPASTVEQQEKEVSLTIYRPTEDAMYLVPVTVKMKLKDDPPKAALAAMIADDRKQKYPILPKGLSVNTIKVKDGIATVDFSKELLNMDKSTTTEELFTAMTVNTLTEFPDIKEV